MENKESLSRPSSMFLCREFCNIFRNSCGKYDQTCYKCLPETFDSCKYCAPEFSVCQEYCKPETSVSAICYDYCKPAPLMSSSFLCVESCNIFCNSCGKYEQTCYKCPPETFDSCQYCAPDSPVSPICYEYCKPAPLTSSSFLCVESCNIFCSSCGKHEQTCYKCLPEILDSCRDCTPDSSSKLQEAANLNFFDRTLLIIRKRLEALVGCRVEDDEEYFSAASSFSSSSSSHWSLNPNLSRCTSERSLSSCVDDIEVDNNHDEEEFELEFEEALEFFESFDNKSLSSCFDDIDVENNHDEEEFELEFEEALEFFESFDNNKFNRRRGKVVKY